MDFIDYREKLGIGFDNKDLENIFFNRFFNILDGLTPLNNQISPNEYFSFCNAIGYYMDHDATYNECWELEMKILHNVDTSIKEFLPYYMFFINTQKDNRYKKYTKENFKNIICNCLKDSHIPFDVYKENGNYFIFPKGVEELDNALVSEPLTWLKDYPQAQKSWINALKSYNNATDATASETADNFRKALERFFQEFFSSEKSLENLKSEYGNFLTSKGIPAEIKNNFEKLLELYTQYINNYAKHHDKTSKNVLEYIMYQTGNLIRLLITLRQS